MIINIFFSLYIIFNIAVFLIISSSYINGYNVNFSFVNPFVIYREFEVNYFGAALICILANILLPVIAIPYWIYKICTIGRR